MSKEKQNILKRCNLVHWERRT